MPIFEARLVGNDQASHILAHHAWPGGQLALHHGFGFARFRCARVSPRQTMGVMPYSAQYRFGGDDGIGFRRGTGGARMPKQGVARAKVIEHLCRGFTGKGAGVLGNVLRPRAMAGLSTVRLLHLRQIRRELRRLLGRPGPAPADRPGDQPARPAS